jgi:hypothetical protein
MAADLDPAVVLGRLVADLQEMGASTTPSFLECLGRCAARSLLTDDFGDRLLQDMSATSRDSDLPLQQIFLPPKDSRWGHHCILGLILARSAQVWSSIPSLAQGWCFRMGLTSFRAAEQWSLKGG